MASTAGCVMARLHQAPLAGAQGVASSLSTKKWPVSAWRRMGAIVRSASAKTAGNGIGLNEVAAHVDVLAARPVKRKATLPAPLPREDAAPCKVRQARAVL